MEKQPAAEPKVPHDHHSKMFMKFAMSIATGLVTLYQSETSKLSGNVSTDTAAWAETKEDIKDMLATFAPATEAEKSMMFEYNASGKSLMEVSDSLLRMKYKLGDAPLSATGKIWVHAVARDIARNNELDPFDIDHKLEKNVLVYPDLVGAYDAEAFYAETNVKDPIALFTVAESSTSDNEKLATN